MYQNKSILFLLYKMEFWFRGIFLLVMINHCYAEVKLQELKSDDILLLNVAVKARLLERLTEETDKIQFERNELVSRHKSCLLNVYSTARACHECVVRKCEHRGTQCKLSPSKLQNITDKLNQDNIPGLDFLSTPSVVQEEIREIKETAETEIMKDVPKDLEPKGKAIMEKIKQGMTVFRDNLGHAVNELPELLPKIEKNIGDISSQIDIQAVENVANQAANQISESMSDPALQGIRVHVITGQKVLKQNLPTIVKTMQDTLSRLKSAVGRFVGVVRVQAGTAWKHATVSNNNKSQTVTKTQTARAQIMMVPQGQQVPMDGRGPQPFRPRLQAPMDPGMVIGGPQPFPADQIGSFDGDTAMLGPENEMNNQPQLQPSIQFPQQFDNTQFQRQLNNAILDNGFQLPQQNVVSPPIWRRKRQADIPCDQIRSRLYEACHSYHFYCTPCMNEKTILEHDCGPGALVAMVAIKELDIQTGSDIVKYRKFVNSEDVIKKVYYDKNSLNEDSGTYARAFITVHMGNEDKVFGTSVLPDIKNIKHAGFEIGDELWDILQNDGETETTLLKQTEEFHTVSPEYLRNDSAESSGIIYTAVIGAIGLIMYMGFVAISVMV